MFKVKKIKQLGEFEKNKKDINSSMEEISDELDNESPDKESAQKYLQIGDGGKGNISPNLDYEIETDSSHFKS